MDINAILPPVELEAIPASPREGEEAPETELDTPASGEGEETSTEDDLDDFEWEGKGYKVPKVLKPRLEQLGHMDADYTRKTQTAAEKARELEDRATRIEEQAKASKEEIGLRAQLHRVETDIDEYNKLTTAQWAELRADDYAKWTEHRLNYQDLERLKGRLAGQISEAETTRSRAAQSEVTKRVEEAEKYAAEKLKGWTAKSASEVVDFAVKKGVETHKMEPHEVTNLLGKAMNPLVIELMYLARIGDEVLKRQTAPKKPAPPTAEPLETVAAKANTPSARLSDKDDTDTWMEKWKKKQARG